MTPLPTVHDVLVGQVANIYRLPYDILHAQMLQESSGDAFAFRFEPAYFNHYIRQNPRAKAAAYGPLAACSFGLLQILLETAMELGYEDRPERLFDPQLGLSWGAKYLVECIAHVDGDVHGGLMRYNGTGAAARAYADAIFVRAGRVIEGKSHAD